MSGQGGDSVSPGHRELPSREDFRALLSRSRFDQIERELTRLFEARQVERGRVKQCHHHHVNPMERSLVSIEDDLHKIMLLLLKQLQLWYEPRPPRARSEPKRGHTDDDHGPIESATEPKTVHERQDSPKTRPSSLPESEYSEFCQKSDRRFQKRFAQLQSDIAQREPSQIVHSHYKLNRNDINFILGMSSEKSHSKTATKQMLLSRLKQHGPLCSRVNTKSAEGRITTPMQIIRRIEAMIDELHLEHEVISRKLHEYQTTSGERQRTKTLDQLSSSTRNANIATLSDHLIHIMDHLYDLHQLNKTILRVWLA